MSDQAIRAAMMIAAYRVPSITAYNRLEAAPRTAELDRSLKAEVRDALWMLTRQWQFGEFEGDDAGSPISAKILGDHTEMKAVGFPNGGSSVYDVTTPLEAVVEREPIRPGLFVAVQMGRYFARLMNAAGLGGYLGRFLTRYPLDYVVERNDLEGEQLFAAASGRVIDGYKLFTDGTTMDPGGTQTGFVLWLESAVNTDISNAEKTEFKNAVADLAAWHGRTYSQPPDSGLSSWLPSQLEYKFTMTSGQGQQQGVTLTAEQYYGGHLDWYSFDAGTADTQAGSSDGSAGPAENLVSFIPAPVVFKGMPNPRFWAMEENQTDFGAIDTSATGLLHLQFAEFGLIYGNDWFVLPYPLQVNTVCEVRGIVITDVFGQHTLLRPAGAGPESVWQRWTMFHLTDKSGARFSTEMIFLPPSLSKSQDGDPLEQVQFLRDEMANMVWAVEGIVPSQAGMGVNGNEMARRTVSLPPFTPAGQARIRYVLGTTVPDNWIPFIPVHMEGSSTEIRLQRARMPAGKGALGMILTEVPPPYFINEEEVPRSGIMVQRSFQRARWLSGESYLWVGRFKQAGKGEGWSNLRFDQIMDIPPS